MTLPGNPNANNVPQVPLYDAVNHQMVAWQADDTTVTTDTSVTPNVTYAQPKAGSVTVSPPTGVVSTVNSTTTLLTSGSTFTGTSESILAFGSISVQAYSDVASAASGLIIEQSQDGTNWDTQAAYTVSAATPFQQTVNTTGKFLRVVYTNGGTNQATFRLQTIKEVNSSPSAGVANQRVNTHSGDIASGSFASGSIASGAVASGAVASGAIASGAYASGSIGSGAIASGAVASGAVASGAIASGAIVDGASATLGAKADTAITDSTTTNTQMSFTKGLVKILNDVWDSVNHVLGFKLVDSAGTNVAGVDSSHNVLTKVNAALPAGTNLIGYIGRSTVAVYSLASTAKTTTPDSSGDLTVGVYTEIGIDINTTAQTGTNPTVQYFWERKGADGNYYVLWQSAVLTAAANTLSTSVGAGMAYNQSLGSTGRLRWVFGGTATPGFTMSINIYGK